MVGIIGRHAWRTSPYRVPIEPSVVDTNSPLAPDLRSLWVPAQQLGANSLVNLAPAPKLPTMAWPTTAGQRPTWISGALGPALNFDGGDQIQNTTWIPAGDGTAFTLAAIFKPNTSTATFQSIYTFSNSAASPSADIDLGWSTSGINFALSSDGTNYSGIENTPPTVNNTYACIVTARSVSDISAIWYNVTTGEMVVTPTATDTSSPSLAITLNRENIGCFQSSAGIINRGNMLFYGAFYWHRPFTDEEMLGWVLNPFSMLRPAKYERRAYVAGGSAQTIDGVGFSNSQAFGVGAVDASSSITGAGFSNTSTFGAGVLDAAATITGVGFTNAQVFGVGDISQPGTAQTVDGVGFTNAQTFGTGVIAAASTITGAGFANSQAFGAGSLDAASTITGVGFTDADSFGTGVLDTAATITGVGFTNTQLFGAGNITSAATITGAGFTNAQTFGAGAIDALATITGVGFANTSTFGTGSIDQAGSPQTIDGAGFANTQAFGAGSIDQEGGTGGEYLTTFRRRRHH